jgi:hypothetical protein
VVSPDGLSSWELVKLVISVIVSGLRSVRWQDD